MVATGALHVILVNKMVRVWVRGKRGGALGNFLKGLVATQTCIAGDRCLLSLAMAAGTFDSVRLVTVGGGRFYGLSKERSCEEDNE
jgi:hypothetical protein